MNDNIKISLSKLIDLAIEEDIKESDITSKAIFSHTDESNAYIMAKDDGIFCGGFVAEEVYKKIDKELEVTLIAKEGSFIKKGDTVLRVKGKTSSILMGERITLNFIQRMCGISTKTKAITDVIKDTDIEILDTRKTLPGFRYLDKYAVTCGGGTNHRIGLYDMVMIKDNHIKAAGSITEAVKRIKNIHNSTFKIEVETTSLDEVKEAVDQNIDIIMLDNMNKKIMQQAIEIINKRSKIEISGNMDKEKISTIKDLDVDYISIGSLTHSVYAFDLSMKFN
jgi:nicotinate-nucleotide pyrophosphorylase (carboxylating)